MRTRPRGKGNAKNKQQTNVIIWVRESHLPTGEYWYLNEPVNKTAINMTELINWHCSHNRFLCWLEEKYGDDIGWGSIDWVTEEIRFLSNCYTEFGYPLIRNFRHVLKTIGAKIEEAHGLLVPTPLPRHYLVFPPWWDPDHTVRPFIVVVNKELPMPFLKRCIEKVLEAYEEAGDLCMGYESGFEEGDYEVEYNCTLDRYVVRPVVPHM